VTRQRDRVRRVNAKRPPAPVRIELQPCDEDRSDLAVAYLLRLLDERRSREGR
jgi:hypothetical protein